MRVMFINLPFLLAEMENVENTAKTTKRDEGLTRGSQLNRQDQLKQQQPWT